MVVLLEGSPISTEELWSSVRVTIRFLVISLALLIAKDRNTYYVNKVFLFFAFLIYDGRQPVLCTMDKSMIKTVLIKECYNIFTNRRDFHLNGELFDAVSVAEDDTWRRIRSVLSPSFTSGRLKEMFGIMKQHSANLLNGMKKQADKDQAIEIFSQAMIFIFEEIDTVFPNKSLRLYPIMLRLERVAKKTVEINGIVIPKDCVVLVPTWALHRDLEIWSDPEEFKPERFSKENKESIDPYTYMPFGAGPRNCIGMRFALIMIKLAIVEILQSLTFSVCDETEYPTLEYHTLSYPREPYPRGLYPTLEYPTLEGPTLP
uniref:Cytochrome P450, family 3, subfamily A, polypeptide 65 n=1 Tax=Hucho hucho TaxID=62062 RepID=A0A4W5R7K2_9TELE